MTNLSNETIQLAKQLIACPSITPNDHGCQTIVIDRLTALGFDIDHWLTEDTHNLLAKIGQGPPYFLFAGHTDVVPPGPLEDWHSPPFEASLRYDKLYGRGACDMKGAISAFVTATERFLSAHAPSGTLMIALTSDEEGTATYGTKEIIKKLNHLNQTVDYCLVGEPTCTQTPGDALKIGRRGSLNGFAHIKGQQDHVAYADPADNPLHQLHQIIHDLSTLKYPAADTHFPATSFHITYLNAGDGTTNVVPGHIDLQFNFRYPPTVSHLDLMAQVDACFKKSGLEFEISWTHSAKPYYSPPNTLATAVANAIKDTYHLTADMNTEGGTSDGRFLIDLGCEIVEFGLMNTTIHQVNECVSTADLLNLSATYEKVLAMLLTDRHKQTATKTVAENT